MNCRQAQDHLLTAREASLAEPVARDLAAHLATCPACRALQRRLDATMDDWRRQVETVTVPDAQTEWHAVRRRLRQAPAASTPLSAWVRLLRVAAPLTAVAAIALVVWQARSPAPDPRLETPAAIAATSVATRDGATAEPFDGTWPEMDQHFAFTAHAEYVETDNEEASPFVYVDDESGWLIVWASDPPDGASI